MSEKGSHNHLNCCCFEPHIRSSSISKSLYLLSISAVSTEVLVLRGIFMSPLVIGRSSHVRERANLGDQFACDSREVKFVQGELCSFGLCTSITSAEEAIDECCN